MPAVAIALPLPPSDPLVDAVTSGLAALWRFIAGLTGLRDLISPFSAGSPVAAPSADTSDQDHVRRCQAGDREAFEQLVYRYQDMIYGLCVRMLGGRVEGEDAAQETFLKAFEGMAGFRGESALSTWLYRIALNVCRNRRSSFWGRLSRRAVRLDEPEEDDEGGVRGRELPSDGESPEQALERRRTAQGVRAALARLPQKHREIIVLADLQERSYEEIRAITGMALGTIKSRLARGREALRELLAGKQP